MTTQALDIMSPFDPALVAVAQSRRCSPDEVFDNTYRRLEDEAADTVSDGMVWEARVDYVSPDGVGAAGHILAARSFGTLLSSLHAQGYLTGDRPADEVLASVRRVRDPRA